MKRILLLAIVLMAAVGGGQPLRANDITEAKPAEGCVAIGPASCRYVAESATAGSVYGFGSSWYVNVYDSGTCLGAPSRRIESTRDAFVSVTDDVVPAGACVVGYANAGSSVAAGNVFGGAPYCSEDAEYCADPNSPAIPRQVEDAHDAVTGVLACVTLGQNCDDVTQDVNEAVEDARDGAYEAFEGVYNTLACALQPGADPIGCPDFPEDVDDAIAEAQRLAECAATTVDCEDVQDAAGQATDAIDSVQDLAACLSTEDACPPIPQELMAAIVAARTAAFEAVDAGFVFLECVFGGADPAFCAGVEVPQEVQDLIDALFDALDCVTNAEVCDDLPPEVQQAAGEAKGALADAIAAAEDALACLTAPAGPAGCVPLPPDVEQVVADAVAAAEQARDEAEDAAGFAQGVVECLAGGGDAETCTSEDLPDVPDCTTDPNACVPDEVLPFDECVPTGGLPASGCAKIDVLNAEVRVCSGTECVITEANTALARVEVCGSAVCAKATGIFTPDGFGSTLSLNVGVVGGPRIAEGQFELDQDEGLTGYLEIGPPGPDCVRIELKDGEEIVGACA